MRSAHGQIDRQRLWTVRDAATHVRLVTLIAPGGYGKTSLAAAWMAQWHTQGSRCAWLGLEPDDDVPARFLSGLTQALRRLGDGIGDDAQALLAGPTLPVPRAVVSVLLGELEQVEDEIFLVLDDYQWVRDPVIHDALAYLLLHAPAHLHVIITSRTRPELPLARLRTQGQWLELGVGELRFDEEETRCFMQTAGSPPFSAAQIQHLHAQTDGWPAALRIAALGMSGAGGRSVPISGVSRPYAHLIEDLLDNLPPETVQFMARTAVLDFLNAGLCEAVTSAADSASQLEQMAQNYLLVEPLDGEGHWFRYHQLLCDYLRGPLTQRLGIDLHESHRRAAHWFAGQAMWTDAVRHSLAAGDTAQALEWLVHCGMALVKKGDLMTLLAWRRAFPPELMRKQPDVQVAVAWGLTLAMRYSDAEQVLGEIEQDETAGILPQCLAVRAVAAALQDDSVRALELAEAWHKQAKPSDAWTENVVSNVQRFAFWKAGRWADVYEQPWVPYSLEDDDRNVFSTVYREVLLGYVELEQARLAVAERHARTALRLAELHNGPRSVAAALAAPLRASILYEQGLFDEAESTLTPLLALIDNVVMLEGVMHSYLVLARIARGRSDLGHAYELLEHAESLGYNRGWDRLVSAMLLERLRWLVADGRFDEARACGVRLGRLAMNHNSTTRCASSDLTLYRDWGGAHLALFDQRSNDAAGTFTVLYSEAMALRFTYRALALGTSLALADMAKDDPDSAFTVLREVLHNAHRSGVGRIILDFGVDLRAMLSRCLVSEPRDPALTSYIQRLLGAYGDTVTMPANALTERERRVLMLVALGQGCSTLSRWLD